MKKVGRPRVIKTAEDLERLWDEYKVHCNDQAVLTHEFAQRQGDFVSKTLKKSISYTIEGFCVFIKISRAAFYSTYVEANEEFAGAVARMREECEVDARSKFELGIIPPQLAALWMGNHGYGTNATNKVEATVVVDDWVKGVMADEDTS